MADLQVRPLAEGLEFGSRVGGVSLEALESEGARQVLSDLFERSGVILFEDIEPSGELQVAISSVAGPLKDHLQKSVARVDQDSLPGVIEMVSGPKFEALTMIDGDLRASWLPWLLHFE